MAYDHTDIEKKAREKWAGLDLYSTDLLDASRELYYLLVEFPYPSGDLHIGHWYAFAVTDIYARLLRARGKNVLFPIGFDAFGLPAENAAIKNGVDPKEWTYTNMERMREQLATMGASFDWSKEVVTCDPEYYHWTQWLFVKLFEHKLAERKEAAVKWCPKDQTVLANEQVQDGCCERCGTPIEEKWLTQWFFKITDYAERLLDGLETLPWRNEIKDAQRAWIGKSEGAKLKFKVQGVSDKEIEVFTTRPDTVFGATYVVLAPEHPLLSDVGFTKSYMNGEEVEKYVKATTKKTERERSENKEKTGVKLEGVVAINPATKEEIPIFIADYVLASYGTGAVMAVPAHDERDFEFAQTVIASETRSDPQSFIKLVVEPDLVVVKSWGREWINGKEISLLDEIRAGRYPYTGNGTLVNSGEFTGRNSEEVKWDIVKAAGGEKTTQYRLRDWLVSRQRYWGCPIPIAYNPEGKPHAIPPEHLPWLLPTDVDFLPKADPPSAGTPSKSPLASSKELKERVTKIFGEDWTPEYDTLDTFVDSSWYFLRYLDPKDSHNFSDTAFMKKWLPIDRYSGGAEHTTMHLLYSRFFIKALYDLALVPVDEPYAERFNRGIILGPDGQKMSKSKGNVVNPDEFVQNYGADAVRIYLAFIGPYNEPGSYPWNLDGVAAMRKFLERIVRLAERAHDTAEVPEAIQQALARASVKVVDDGDRFKFNTAVAALMILTNELEAFPALPKKALKQLIVMLAPFAPHLTEHVWEKLGGKGSVHQQLWPAATLAAVEEREVVVQVNGKRRGSLALATSTSESDAVIAARIIPAVVAALGGKEPVRVVYVPGKVLNLVVPR
ncbi:leucine--tRNA ligase [Candidatus Kaiserbacteria bacterium RIFCSPLOWO2_02_FULL_54_13]|uniref:Leucine--tRNA ligase n=1 Tax=Candidatus Kaiserbacteria bacterium RIFCSPHIGHO2_02_FULL_54_22 TaxID=1798495 RepID=A0A1F6DN99_9BACT|nr:MAG: leucine--tRNA ligase [Candidatus Kaiserbacteria bacterium RIFCSPHIGHO2_02_FULL_54_22]OGG68008.1 MAG: leucine--tRNA ligase [Candidatus Kaiserbacteria bacterium RIFCSPHIGHO2_12_FULL_54_16]OGG83530.1 MAG: leucine--tRNA ligase [Candidatus Kaiserbacteria bacterium RIFCSPLOWO2_02_FULL_54_13]OGG90067.1 MAG: leucine--tRNA ligase [Candidatus Kaiserbacteria bacterium RIFCSPLOWO2_12_FULL_54_10]